MMINPRPYPEIEKAKDLVEEKIYNVSKKVEHEVRKELKRLSTLHKDKEFRFLSDMGSYTLSCDTIDVNYWNHNLIRTISDLTDMYGTGIQPQVDLIAINGKIQGEMF